MQKLLIIKTSSLGDVIHCLPVVNDIRAHYPNAQIDWVVEESFADIPRMHAGVNNVYTVAMRRWRKALFSQNTWAEVSAFNKNIKQNQYDAVIDCQGLLKSALITKQALTTIHGLKHGYDKNSIREPIASQFYEKKHAISYQQHAVTRNRTLVAMSMGYAPPTNAPDYGIKEHGIPSKKTQNNGSATRMDIGLQGDGLNKKFIIALHGTSRESKLWPIAKWIELGQQLAQQDLSLVLPWANDAELARAKTIQQQTPKTVVLPQLNVHALAGVIAQAQAAIGVDTGLSHLAAALNIPTIAIYTDSNPALTGLLAGAFAPAINLGGINEIPSVRNVADAYNKMIGHLIDLYKKQD